MAWLIKSQKWYQTQRQSILLHKADGKSEEYSEYVKNENMTGKIKKIKFSVCDKATRNVIEMVKVLKDDFK